MAVDRPRRGIRLTDADREAAAGRLLDAHDEGRISLDELDERLAHVYGASVAGDLEPLFADVPTEHERRLLAGQGSSVTLRVGAGGLVRDGRWVVPRRLRVEQPWTSSIPGEVTLDFRTAVVRYPQVDLDLRIAGPAQLVLPAGGTADLSALQGPGRPARTAVPARRSTGGLHLVVTGTVVRRRAVHVTHRRRPRWWSTWTM